MTIFEVTCGYRQDDGMNYSQSTHRDTVTVQALDIAEARTVAIDAMYAKHGVHCSHVKPRQVRELDNAEALAHGWR